MKVLTSLQMKEIDRRAIEELGIPGVVLMENAGLEIVRATTARIPDFARRSILIVAGKGNNGGDGLVVARHLSNRGARPKVLLLASKAELRGDAALNLEIAVNIGVDVEEVLNVADWKAHRKDLDRATLMIDAIFGTGLSNPAEGLHAAAIEDINKSGAYKVAVDIPSGLSSDTHRIIGPSVKADLTVTLAAPKISHVLPPAEERVGELVVADIGIPPFLFEDEKYRLEFLERESIRPYFRRRERDSHKGSYGHLLILAGSRGKTGAAVMSARAALRMGLVTVGTPESCLPAIARSTMELMTEPLPETPERTLSEAGLPRILEMLRGKDALLLGPGLSTHPSTARLVLSLLPKLALPVVIDADGLNIVAENVDILKSLSCPAVITPHPGEFARLVRRPVPEILDKRLEVAPEFAEKYGVHLVFKGYRTLVISPRGRVSINPTGNPGMATGGTGDVLGGMIASLLIQEKDALGAALAAVYAHGLSGDLGARRLGERSLVAGDLIRFLPQAVKDLESR